MTSSIKTLLTRSALSACAVFLLLATPSKAVTITLNSTSYDIVASNPGLSPQDYQTTLESQVWWGDSALAQSAASQVGSQLGFTYAGFYGPFFVYDNSGTFWSAYSDASGSGVTQVGILSTYDGFTFAVADSASSVPDSTSTVAALGLALVGLAGLRRKFGRA